MAHPRPGAAPAAPLDQVTVVVPFLGPAEELDGTLAALGPTGPVIVVDDGSADPAAVATVARRHGAEHRAPPANRGPGRRPEHRLALATTELVAFLDGGCVPDADWLESLLPHLDDPQVAAVAPRITAASDVALPRSLAAYEQAHPTLDRGTDEAIVRLGAGFPSSPPRPPGAPVGTGGCRRLRRDHAVR